MGFFHSIANLLFTKLALGFLISLIVHSNAKCSWQKLGSDEKTTVFTYFFGTFFSIHVFAWFGVFYFLYASVISVAIKCLVQFFESSAKYELLVVNLAEIGFGYWAAGDILGGWCDLERIGDCIQDEKEELDFECQSFIINGFARLAQSICERLSSSYDEVEDVYVRSEPSACIFVFRYLGHFIMTAISFAFTFYVMC